MEMGVGHTASLMNVPPAEVHFAVATQTPGSLDLPVQGPFSSERRRPLNVAVEKVERRNSGRIGLCIVDSGKGFVGWKIEVISEGSVHWQDRMRFPG